MEKNGEKRHNNYSSISPVSVKILNRLKEIDTLENNIPARECKTGIYIDKALQLLAEKEGIII